MASGATKSHIFQQLFSIKILTKLSYWIYRFFGAILKYCWRNAPYLICKQNEKNTYLQNRDPFFLHMYVSKKNVTSVHRAEVSVSFPPAPLPPSLHHSRAGSRFNLFHTLSLTLSPHHLFRTHYALHILFYHNHTRSLCSKKNVRSQETTNPRFDSTNTNDANEKYARHDAKWYEDSCGRDRR